MKSFLVLLSCLAAFAYGDLNSGFRVRWTGSSDTNGYFINVPSGIAYIITSNEWNPVTRADGLFADYSMYCYKKEVTFCAFYDKKGHVRGFQVSVLKSAYSGGPVTLDKLGFSTWQYKNQDYWTIQQFFAKDAGQTSWDSKKLLQQNSVFVPTPGNSKNYIEVGNSLNALDTSVYSKKGCVPTMGTHYFKDNTKDCNDILPWFFLYNGQQLVGSGFWLYGNYKLNQPNGPTVDMFEYWTDPEITRNVVDNSKCIMDHFGKYKIFSMHIFYVDDYSKISC